MIIGISNDHAATQLKFDLIKYLEEKGHTVINFGTDSFDASNYPDQAKIICKAYQDKKIDLGIAMCGTGVGISIACNKHKGIRACCCSEPTSIKLSRLHNDANILCIGARIVGLELAKDIVDAFVNTKFSNEDRHINRVCMLNEM